MPINIQRSPLGEHTIRVVPTAGVRLVGEGPQGKPGVQGVPGPQGAPGDLTRPVADATYERKLIDTAVWRVDAGAVGTDGKSLIDLSGGNRPAVFGAGAAKPVVLPWDGEDYVYNPRSTSAPSNRISVPAGNQQDAPIPQSLTLDIEVSIFDLTAAPLFYYRGFGVQPSGSALSVFWWDGAAKRNALSASGEIVTGKRMALRAVFTATAAELYKDGVLIATGAISASAYAATYIGLCSDSSNYAGHMNVYSAGVVADGESTFILDPRNVNADYTKIKNTGTAGGDWAIQRASSGFKTVVVDRPLVLFGGGQTLQAPTPRPTDNCTVLAAFRHHNASGTIETYAQIGSYNGPNGLRCRANGSNVGVFAYGDALASDSAVVATTRCNSIAARVVAAGAVDVWADSARATDAVVNRASGPLWAPGAITWIGSAGPPRDYLAAEFLGAAIFDRALTDAEVAQASAELLGLPHTEQPDPHPQYAFRSQQTRVSRPNGTDRLVEVWDGTAWVVTHYDSGVRDLKSLASVDPDRTHLSYAYFRRVGNVCTLSVYLANATTVKKELFAANGPLAAFRPHNAVQWLVPRNASLTVSDAISARIDSVGRFEYVVGNASIFITDFTWTVNFPAIPTSLPGTPIGQAP